MFYGKGIFCSKNCFAVFILGFKIHIGVHRFTFILQFTFAPNCLATDESRYRRRSDRPIFVGSEVFLYCTSGKMAYFWKFKIFLILLDFRMKWSIITKGWMFSSKWVQSYQFEQKLWILEHTWKKQIKTNTQ